MSIDISTSVVSELAQVCVSLKRWLCKMTTVHKLKIYPTVESEVEEPQVHTPYQQLLLQSEQQNEIDFERWKVGGLNSECVS